MKAIFLFLIILCLSCSKDENKCEQWKYWEECIPKNSSVICPSQGPANIITGRVCGDDLNGVRPGATITVREDSNRKVIRHYTEKVN